MEIYLAPSKVEWQAIIHWYNRLFYVCILLLISFYNLSNQAWAWNDEELKNIIQNTIQMRHPRESGSWWRSLGPRAPKVIIQMYQGEGNIYYKLRLMDALAWFDDEDASFLIKKEIKNQTNQVIKNSAIFSLIQSQGLRERGLITQLLEGRNPHNRVVALRALKSLKNNAVQEFIKPYLVEEKDPGISSQANPKKIQKLMRIENHF